MMIIPAAEPESIWPGGNISRDFNAGPFPEL